MRDRSYGNTNFTVWAEACLRFYLLVLLNNAPNERVPVHWENRYLLPFSDLDIEERNSYSAQGRKIHAATDSQAVRPRLECG